jgi:hypothetical protein
MPSPVSSAAALSMIGPQLAWSACSSTAASAFATPPSVSTSPPSVTPGPSRKFSLPVLKLGVPGKLSSGGGEETDHSEEPVYAHGLSPASRSL